MRKRILSLLITLTTATAVFAQADKPMLFRQPTMNRADIVFVYAGDLWKVPRTGGSAERLTSGNEVRTRR